MKLKIKFLLSAIFAMAATIPPSQAAPTYLPANERRSGEVSMAVRADGVILAFSISSSKGSARNTLASISKAWKEIQRETETEDAISLIEDIPNITQLRPPKGKLIDSRSSDPPALASTLHVALYTPLSPSENYFDGADRLLDFLGDLNFPNTTQIEFGSLHLAVKDPERYRASLLEKGKRALSTLRSNNPLPTIITVTGMDTPLKARTVNAAQVELSLDYNISVKARLNTASPPLPLSPAQTGETETNPFNP